MLQTEGRLDLFLGTGIQVLTVFGPGVIVYFILRKQPIWKRTLFSVLACLLIVVGYMALLTILGDPMPPGGTPVDTSSFVIR